MPDRRRPLQRGEIIGEVVEPKPTTEADYHAGPLLRPEPASGLQLVRPAQVTSSR